MISIGSSCSLIFISLTLLHLMHFIDVQAIEASDKAKAQSHRKYMLGRAKDNALIQLGDKEFREHILGDFRMYHTILFVSSSDPQQCPGCESVSQVLGNIANAFEKTRFPSGKQPKHFLFFSKCELSPSTQSLFQDLQVKSIPLILYLKPSTSSSPASSLISSIPPEAVFSLQGATVEGLLQWIESQSGVKAPHQDQQQRQGDGRSAGGGVGVSSEGLIALGVTIMLPLIYWQRNNPMVYFFAALLIFLFSISAGMYNVIRKVPFTTVDRDGSVSYFSPGVQQQLGAGGYIAGTTQVVLGLLFVAIPSVILKQKNPIVRNGLLVLVAVLAYVLFLFIRFLFSKKMGGYDLGWVWSLRDLMRA